MIAPTDRQDGSAGSAHLTVQHALLFEAQVLGGVGHYSEAGFGIMPENTEIQKYFSVSIWLF